MAREFYCAYHSNIEAMEQLTDAECGRLFRACLLYSKTGEVPKLGGNERFVFPGMKSQIDRDKEKYENTCKTNKRNGSIGGVANATERKRTPPNAPQRKEKDKGEGKDKGYFTDSAEPSSTPPTEPPVISFVLNDGSLYGVTDSQVKKWSVLYPAVDIGQALRNMCGWLDANPKKRKTKAGIERFIVAWLGREQDKGGSGGKAVVQPKPYKKTVTEQQYSQRPIDPAEWDSVLAKAMEEASKL